MDYKSGVKGVLKPKDYKELVSSYVSRIISMISGLPYEAAQLVAYFELYEIERLDPTIAYDVQNKLRGEAEQLPQNPLLSPNEIYVRNLDCVIRALGEEINDLAQEIVRCADEKNLSPEIIEMIGELKTSKINFS